LLPIATALLGFAAGALLGWYLAAAPQRKARQRRAQLRHDLRNAMAPALMVAERLSANAAPDIRNKGEILEKAVNQMVALLQSD
jgi:hypothetical protein